MMPAFCIERKTIHVGEAQSREVLPHDGEGKETVDKALRPPSADQVSAELN